jgi:hypothetical protein
MRAPPYTHPVVAANMGHCRTGTFSGTHTVLLSTCTLRNICVRCASAGHVGGDSSSLGVICRSCRRYQSRLYASCVLWCVCVVQLFAHTFAGNKDDEPNCCTSDTGADVSTALEESIADKCCMNISKRVSARNGHNVQPLLRTIAHALLEQHMHMQDAANNNNNEQMWVHRRVRTRARTRILGARRSNSGGRVAARPCSYSRRVYAAERRLYKVAAVHIDPIMRACCMCVCVCV